MLPRMMDLLPPIDLVLRDYFDTSRAGLRGLRRRRVDTTELQLRAFLESEGPSQVCADCQAVLQLERQFGAESAFARFMFPDALVELLGPFLERQRPTGDTEQRRVEVRLVEGLATYLDDYQLFDRRELALPFLQLMSAIYRAKHALRRTPADSRKSTR
jgi:hypothetical protein